MGMDGYGRINTASAVGSKGNNRYSVGSVRSYKQIAEAVHRPRAYRFVGSTLAKNPFPILIPCHRVIRSDSSLGLFGGGTDLKRKLIDLEAQFVSKKMMKS